MSEKGPQKQSDRAAPADWMALVNEKCDLDLAFEALEGWNHFYTDTIRGRIRSLQLRPKEATTFFDLSAERVDDFPNTLRNFLRRFYHRIYVFENAIIAESESGGGDPKQTDRHLKDLMEMEIPETEIALQTRQYHKGLFFLHRDKADEAKKCFLRIIRQSRERMGDEKTAYYIGAAAAHKQLDEDKEAEKQLEYASLYIPTLENTLNMGIYSATLSALLQVWERPEEAQEWLDFLGRLKIPVKTREILLDRYRRIVARSLSLQRAFIF